ncbi:MAG: dihydropteroate synthase, partial [Bryobacteraceae bacterium]
RDLGAAISRARRVGIAPVKLAIDPGLGLGKRKEQNALILGRLGALAALDLPIMAGPSRKSFLAHQDAEQTKFATAAAVTACVLGGVHMVRVHDVREMRAVTDLADEILRAQAE